ncbi:tripartite tricarboxylate transporter substrate binding protein [Enterovirga sp.]|uniref:Bug family tripartite tricarboxylate transporter substrate binding protein n=1 Tax=Enterovirga sp. TaxID=2026350 RepID=UPI002CE38F79|nr:tripartite tricarboxylate transporter substrate binding protein [Enterovirga sp.]HMO29502.1 tripartite tricarboxylate transporter substrate binding protein [Enterovirga sp.]
MQFRLKPHLSRSAAILAACLAGLAGQAGAQGDPARPAALVVAYPEGGTGTIIGQPLAERLSQILGRRVTLEYRAGASGASGAQSVARAAPDGSTLLLGQTGELVINRHLVKDLGYDPERDFQPVATVALIPLALVVRADAPFGTVDELLKAARASKRGLTFSSGGPGTTAQFAGELLRLRSAARLVHVPSDGAAAALRAVLDGQVDFYFAPLPTALPAIKDGKLKVLAVSLPSRAQTLPAVPTMAEAGFRDITLSAWITILAPRDTPANIVQTWNSAVNQALGESELRDRLTAAGAEVSPRSPQQTGAFIRDESARYLSVITEEFCSHFGYGGCAGYGVYE